MKKTIAMIHATYKAIPPMEKAFRELAPDYVLQSHVDEAMLAAVNRHGGVQEEDLREFTRLVFTAMDSDADLILVCCSIFCSYVPLMRQFTDKPIIAINAPMLEKAAAIGGRIGIVSTTPTSGPHTQRQIEKILAQTGADASFVHEIVPDAISALKNGDAQTHNQIIAQAAIRLKEQGCSCVLLSQITMAQAKQLIPADKIPVLTSPEEGALAVREALEP